MAEVDSPTFCFTGARVVISPAFQIVAKTYTFLIEIIYDYCLLTGVTTKPFVLWFIIERITIVFVNLTGFAYA